MLNERNLSYFSIYKELLVTFFVIVACLVLIFFFPAQNYLQTITVLIFFLIFVPILYLKIVVKKNIREFGLKLGNKKEGLISGAVAFFAFLALFFLLYYYTGFKKSYILPDLIIHNFWNFLVYELLIANFLILLLEFFFCGFVFFSFYEYTNRLAILVQFILFTGIAILFFGFSWQIFPALVISLFSGIIVYRSQSILYSYVFALLSFIILDSFIIYHLK